MRKANTYYTGKDDVVKTGQMVEFAGYGSIPASVWGEDVVLTNSKEIEKSGSHYENIWQGTSDGTR